MDFYHFMNWLQTNRKRLTIGGAVVVAIGAIIAIVIWHNNQTEADANAALMALPSSYGAGGHYSAHPNATALEDIAKQYPAVFNLHVWGMNANGKVYSQDKILTLKP